MSGQLDDQECDSIPAYFAKLSKVGIDKVSIAERRKILGLVRDSWKNHSPEHPLDIYSSIIQIDPTKHCSIAEFCLFHVMKGHMARHHKKEKTHLDEEFENDWICEEDGMETD